MSTAHWHVIQLASRALWLPTFELEGLITIGGLRTVAAGETAWEAGALVPDHDWRTTSTTHPGITNRAFDRSVDVALMPVLDDLELLPPEQLLKGLGDVERYLDTSTNPPGRSTLTFNPETGRLIGLHLDNWDRRLPASRCISRNRASINLGPGWRAFVFVDIDALSGHPDQVVPDTRSTRLAMERAPTSPAVFRLMLPPGWAYIAPTESMLHDASSEGCGDIANSAAALGTFTPTPDLAKVTAVTLA